MTTAKILRAIKLTIGWGAIIFLIWSLGSAYFASDNPMSARHMAAQKHSQ